MKQRTMRDFILLMEKLKSKGFEPCERTVKSLCFHYYNRRTYVYLTINPDLMSFQAQWAQGSKFYLSPVWIDKAGYYRYEWKNPPVPLIPFTANIYLTIMADPQQYDEKRLTSFLKEILSQYNGTEYTCRVKECKVKQQRF